MHKKYLTLTLTYFQVTILLLCVYKYKYIFLSSRAARIIGFINRYDIILL